MKERKKKERKKKKERNKVLSERKKTFSDNEVKGNNRQCDWQQ